MYQLLLLPFSSSLFETPQPALSIFELIVEESSKASKCAYSAPRTFSSSSSSNSSNSITQCHQGGGLDAGLLGCDCNRDCDCDCDCHAAKAFCVDRQLVTLSHRHWTIYGLWRDARWEQKSLTSTERQQRFFPASWLLLWAISAKIPPTGHRPIEGNP